LYNGGNLENVRNWGVADRFSLGREARTEARVATP